ncbi:DUF6514 family protein [Clostridium sp. D33t1_170424_F3]|uniref:DUF6514 family protein n=1 Tax=Clostridium sp. D33t1_170424_F3 TaxID=2787099 RepID=UPI0018AB83B2
MSGYKTILEHFEHPELGCYDSYGILGEFSDQMIKLSDVSICREKVEKAVAVLNAYQVSYLHLMDIISDFCGTDELLELYGQMIGQRV